MLHWVMLLNETCISDIEMSLQVEPQLFQIEESQLW